MPSGQKVISGPDKSLGRWINQEKIVVVVSYLLAVCGVSE
jgi:quinolinate synthase